jgi:gamma-glutamylcyclotransferase (GGCT)/AIG2-like uncharacterized protein YtfP
MSAHLFVYGTLLPDQPQWELLRRYVTDLGWATSVAGQLFDTGLGYPVADFEQTATTEDQVIGRVFTLLSASAEIALGALDHYEDVGLGLYRRIQVTTADGTTCWAYCLGPTAAQHFAHLTPIHSGDWVRYLNQKI